MNQKQTNKLSLFQLALISIGVTVFAFALFSVLFTWFLNAFCKWAGYCDIPLLDGYAGLVQLALIVGGLVFAFWEYRRQESEIAFQIYESVYERLTDLEDEAARRWILQNLPTRTEFETAEAWLDELTKQIHKKPRGWKQPLPPGQMHLKRVLNTFDYIGFIAQNYGLTDPILEWMSAPIAKVWERVGAYVENESVQRNEKDYYQAARSIGQDCLQYRDDHGFPRSTIIENAT